MKDVSKSVTEFDAAVALSKIQQVKKREKSVLLSASFNNQYKDP